MMNNNAIDSYQLSSLVELTSNIADDSMRTELSSQEILLNAVNKLLWTLNFDFCMMVYSANQVECLYGEPVTALTGKISKLPIKTLKNNTTILIAETTYYLTYQALPLGNNKTNILVFIKQDQSFNSSSLIIIELFSAAVKRLLITKEQEDKRLQLKNEAQVLLRSNQLKSEFLANMSHELKTPMNGILNLVKLLQNTELNTAQNDLLNTIHESTGNLLTVISDVLEYSKLDTNDVKLLSASFTIEPLIQNLILSFEHEINLKGLKLTFNIDKRIPTQLLGDSLRIKQILHRLLCNAVKFTHQGEIRLSVYGNELINDTYNLVLKVQDTGIGMTQETQSWLFEPFIQGDNSLTREYGGIGLGLAICSKLVKSMQGKIQVKSQPNEGSEFEVSLPLQYEIEAQIVYDKSADCSTQSTAQLKPHSILIVEDNIINQKVAGLLLNKLGYTFDVAENGQVALEQLEKKQYTFIFMDIQMPVMNGHDATIEIISRYNSQRPIIVAMTANTFEEDKEKCLSIGMDDFIAKPISEEEIIRVLSSTYLINRR